MPYALIERQREYQRLWSKNKKYKRMCDIAPNGRTRARLENIDGTTNLKSTVITWKELTKEDVKKISSYSECVTRAKGYMLGRRINRMAIAAIALRSCEIRHGGKTGKYDTDRVKPSLTKFANDIGIHVKTLDRWVQIKIRIADKLTEEMIDYTAAEAAVRASYKQKTKSAVELYRDYSNQDPFEYKGILTERYLANAAKILTTIGYKKFQPDSIKRIKVHLSAINKIMD